MDRRQIWGLAELIFWQKSCLQNWFLAQMRLPEPDFWAIFRLWNWKFTKFKHFEQKIGKFCDFWLQWGLVELKNAEKGVLWSGWGSVKRGSLPPDIPVTLFKVSTPPAPIKSPHLKVRLPSEYPCNYSYDTNSSFWQPLLSWIIIATLYGSIPFIYYGLTSLECTCDWSQA